ncbi:hypothetical protein BBB39_18720 [Bordetella trematum]|nr:hypothetical protein BBB39_18720 [Bordetella trematum]
MILLRTPPLVSGTNISLSPFFANLPRMREASALGALAGRDEEGAEATGAAAGEAPSAAESAEYPPNAKKTDAANRFLLNRLSVFSFKV